ncbi:MAG TPA: ABC transporter permease [Saprospiraceae bacterium]|nr:ABC transporter permease [Saprospiraceae bacterium]HQW24927.1 ABC transporter permease [Saprospiraceae bacterium]
MFFKLIYESIVQAFQQLSANKLRSFLSLTGISIGIICIISVLSAVDSLKDNVSASFEKLGNDVLYIDKMPWNEDPSQNWWKYQQRPQPSYEDLEVIKKKSKLSDMASFSVFMPSRTIKFGASSIEGAFMAGVTDDYAEIFNFDFEKGRFFTPFESANGTNRVILGAVVAEKLFGTIDPIGKEINIKGLDFQVIGVLRKEGTTLINIFQFDEAVVISFNTAKKLINVKSRNSWGTSLNVKAMAGVNLDDLKDEITGILRSARKIKPRENENFAVNQLSMFTNLLEPIFSTMNVVGIFIGGFSILVGMFSVANIMFVSVKERTSIIGIKKALGARPIVILLEFLIESVVLCLVGALIGLLIVYGLLKLATVAFSYQIYLSGGNILIALILSLVIGILSGLIPAWQAARLDPVEAMRK